MTAANTPRVGVNMALKVYRYGLLAPTENADLVRQQIRLAHEYRNKLVEIERAERAEVRALQATHGSIPALQAAAQAAEAAREAAYVALKQHKAQERRRAVPEPLKAAYDAAKATSRDAARALREARHALKGDPQIAIQRDAISLRYAERRKEARAACGVYWGTYLLIEAADQQSRKQPLWDGTQPNDPRFVRWTGEGSVAVQIQNGLPVQHLHKSLHVRVEDRAAPSGVDPASKRSAKRRYATVALRVGTQDREPVWARWPAVLHRPLPEDGVIKWARVQVRKIGPREEWCLLLTVESAIDTRIRPPAEPVNRVAVDIGWRKRDGGSLRVAAWRSDSGDSGTLLLDSDMLSQATKADSLRSIRDQNFESARAALLAALQGVQLPDWFPTNLWQWRSIARLSALVRKWKACRFDGDALAYTQLEAWRYNDHHLWAWEASQREKALRHRKDYYRNFAAQLARCYTHLVIENFDLRDVAQKPPADRQEGDNEQARANRARGATSELRLALVGAFAGSVVKVPAEYTTLKCHACGTLETWDPSASIEHTCGACGAVWDQDDNAARNLLAYREQGGDGSDAGTARSDEKAGESEGVAETRWAKAKRMGKEKRGRVEAARNQTAGAAE